ncbi:efflux RND transporter periplasmic adaptor subunit [Frigidibacter albus]|uniref:Efflux RND transporter periplasmic adaptor subunit n=1 Tax=Frigidibacter albus TaxID=1465486 RepID=A0A6L8VFD0_9RHOB|nr:efflux RND transporter periplasmic adaptor subunit [Frigidibacter albus]MZQ88292.1 efflux RND transporter periplasmic adaptor subunit [Frigidibacter albus]NBE30034.1 efflux RND transporter periplasmic adaptor subunit [Frigidibacter albus]GGH46301.1 membrane protein [Frigidibacter albus]
MRALMLTALLAFAAALPGHAETLVLAPQVVTDWKAVSGRIEARDTIPARARLGGTLIEVTVTEGDTVQAGQPIAEIEDQKLGFQIGAIDAQLQSLRAQQENAQAELARGEELLARGVSTAQRLDALRTQLDVLTGQIAAQQAQRQVVEQQAAEGTVLAPVSGRVLAVPQTRGAVVMAGEAVAMIGGGGFFLRVAVPERHAALLAEGAVIGIETATGPAEGRLVKVYPQIETGRVIADVEVPGLDAAFVDARVLVRLPMGSREALLVPQSVVATRSGLDFVRVTMGEQTVDRSVVLGGTHQVDGAEMIEVLTGLVAGDSVVTGNE